METHRRERRGWTGNSYPVFPVPTEESIREHMTEHHGYVQLRRERPDHRPADELVARHARVHAIGKEGLMDGHFHDDDLAHGDVLVPLRPMLDSGGIMHAVPPSNPTMATFLDEEATAAVIAESFERVSEQWRLLMERAEGDHEHPSRVDKDALHFVLINVFGSPEKYLYDAEFHAQVKLAEQMIRQARLAVERNLDRERQ